MDRIAAMSNRPAIKSWAYPGQPDHEIDKVVAAIQQMLNAGIFKARGYYAKLLYKSRPATKRSQERGEWYNRLTVYQRSILAGVRASKGATSKSALPPANEFSACRE